jgi:Asp-tRNA(Asn)/Glu-tRNA(Gln) amidotransferase C subunit
MAGCGPSVNKSMTRKDEIEESVPTKEFLANAPQSKDDYVLIPRVHMEQ